jgi:hypothetical protein
MIAQGIRRRRCAVALQVVRRSAKNAFAGHDRPNHPARGKRQLVGQQGEVDLFQAAGGLDVGLQFDRDMGVLPMKLRNGGRHQVRGDPRQGEHAHGSGHLRRMVVRRLLGFIDIRQDAVHTNEVGVARRCQCQAACGALQQLHAEVVFKLLHPARRTGSRNPQLARSGDEALLSDHLLEHFHGLKPVHQHPFNKATRPSIRPGSSGSTLARIR